MKARAVNNADRADRGYSERVEQTCMRVSLRCRRSVDGERRAQIAEPRQTICPDLIARIHGYPPELST
jgi:hypothetical protein